MLACSANSILFDWEFLKETEKSFWVTDSVSNERGGGGGGCGGCKCASNKCTNAGCEEGTNAGCEGGTNAGCKEGTNTGCEEGTNTGCEGGTNAGCEVAAGANKWEGAIVGWDENKSDVYWAQSHNTK